MNAFVYILYRPKSQTCRYSLPIFSANDEAALNALVELSNTQPEIQNSYLYKIGEYDLSRGKMKIYKNKEIVKNEKVPN